MYKGNEAGKTLCLLIFFLLLITQSSAFTPPNVRISVVNSTNMQRREVVAVDARKIYKQLRATYGSPLIVRNAYGQQVVSQLASDSTLLIEASVSPQTTVHFNVTCGVAMPVKSSVDGQLYAWRMDDFTWENDLTAYRAYGPALQRAGEKAFGYDVWLKSVSYPVVERRYAEVYQANQREQALRLEGRNEEADSVKREHSLHLDHGNGLDCYNVGPTLGCGAPALMMGDSIVMPYCYEHFNVLENGPLRFTAEFVYPPAKIDGQDNVIEHRLISLDKGSYFNRITVWYENLKKPIKFCSGVVLHTDSKSNIRLGNNFVQYADPTDNQEKHGFQIYVATLFPFDRVNTRILWNNQLGKGITGHALCETTIKTNHRITYYFGAGWTGSGVRHQDMWQQEIDTFLAILEAPLKLSVN